MHDGGAVYRNLVGSGVEQARGVLDGTDPAAYGEGDVDPKGDALHQGGERAAPFLGGADVQVDQFVGAVTGVLYAHSDGVPDFAEPLEIDALDDLAVLYIEAGDDALCDHDLISSKVM